jgi:hypothetical protein
LDNPVANANELALFINFVRQEPTTAYSASGTTLTLTSATSASDDMYCVFLGKAVQTVNPPNASVGNSQTAPTIITGQTAETSIATDDTILIHDTSAGALRKMTRANFVSGVGGANTPAFHATLSADQGLSSATFTKVNCDAELFDTNNNYDNSTNYRFTPTTAGKYFVYGQTSNRSGSNDINFTQCAFFKNGNHAGRSYVHDGGTSNALFGRHSHYYARIFDMNGSSDYLELYSYVSATTPQIEGGAIDTIETVTFFGAYKIIE